MEEKRLEQSSFAGIRKLGVIGGMGPIASAAFMRTLYNFSHEFAREQDQLPVILVSDPSIPDRTESLTSGNISGVVTPLTKIISDLDNFDVSHIVICCFTLHSFLPQLSPDYIRKIVPLPRLAVEALQENPGKSLVLCTSGTREYGLFTRDETWGLYEKSSPTWMMLTKKRSTDSFIV